MIDLQIDKLKFGKRFATWYGEALQFPENELRIRTVVPAQHPKEGELKEKFEMQARTVQ